MKNFLKADLQADAQRLMQAHGKEQVFATQDGNYFFQGHDAHNHNFTLKKDSGDDELQVFGFNASGEEAPESAVVEEIEIVSEQPPTAAPAVAEAQENVDADSEAPAADDQATAIVKRKGPKAKQK